MAGSKGAYSRWVGNDLVYYTPSGTEIFRIAGGSIGILHQINIDRTVRKRVTAAQINAGFTLLAALPGYKYRVTDVTLIAIGGNAGGATAITVSGTQSAGAAVLFSVAVAALTQSAVVKPNSANVTVLADGASFLTNDVNTAITITRTVSDLTTATNIDVIMTYAIET